MSFDTGRVLLEIEKGSSPSGSGDSVSSSSDGSEDVRGR